jgi:hypothetical protein
VTGTGIEDRPLMAIHDPPLTAVVSDYARSTELSKNNLWVYERVIEELMSDHTVLPARFGSVFADGDAVARMLSERREEFSARLEQVRGAVELAVRASWSGGQAMSMTARSGTDYLQRRLVPYREARDLAACIDTALRELARAGWCRVLTRPTEPVTAAYLVDRERIPEFVGRVQEAQAAIEGAQLVCTGPWPPYSFVGEDRDV